MIQACVPRTQNSELLLVSHFGSLKKKKKKIQKTNKEINFAIYSLSITSKYTPLHSIYVEHTSIFPIKGDW
jgi:hypothetical protein